MSKESQAEIEELRRAARRLQRPALGFEDSRTRDPIQSTVKQILIDLRELGRYPEARKIIRRRIQALS